MSQRCLSDETFRVKRKLSFVTDDVEVKISTQRIWTELICLSVLEVC